MAQILPDERNPHQFHVKFLNKTSHEMDVAKVWQQCVVTDKTDKTCDGVKSGESCTLRVVNDCHGIRRTEIRYRAFFNVRNDRDFRSHCSNTSEHADCPAVTIKARNPTEGDGRPTTTVTRKSHHYPTKLEYDDVDHTVTVVIGD